MELTAYAAIKKVEIEMPTVNTESKASVAKPWLKYYDPADLAAEMPVCSLYANLYEHNKEHLDDTAIVYFDKEISYGTLFENAQKAARAYLAHGVKEGDVVVFVCATTPEIVYSFYAMDLIGAVPNMVDPRYSPDGIREYIEEVNAKMVVTLTPVYDKVKEGVEGTEVEKILCISPAESLPGYKRFFYRLANQDHSENDEIALCWRDFLSVADDDQPLPEIEDRAHKACIIVHTGGTTGASKAVMLSDHNLNSLAFQIGHCRLKFHRGQRFLDVMPPFIAYGFGYGIHLPLVSGVTTIIIPELDPEQLAKLILKYRAEHMAGVPSHFTYIRNDKRMRNQDLSFLVNCCAGGDAITIPAELAVNDFFREHNCPNPLTKGYGMTELSALACACMGEINKPGSVGIPLVNTTVGIFDPDTGEELAIGEQGEICVSGPTTMLGYYGNEEATKNVIRRHDDGLEWVHTGDIGSIDEDGFVFIDGRIKRVIIRHDGFKVFPPLIENVVDKHPAVKACAVVGTPDPTKPQGQLPVVHIMLQPNITQTPDEVQQEIAEMCAKELPEYVQPAYYVFHDSMPYTPIGKIDYRALEEASIKPQESAEASA